MKLDNDLLDKLIEKLAYTSLEITNDICGKELDQTSKIEYICRAYTEILSVLIIAAPSSEVQKICKNITHFLNSTVSFNLNLSANFGFPQDKSSLEDLFKDSFLTNKKAIA